MKTNRTFSITLTVLTLAATSLATQAKPSSITEDWRTYRRSFLPTLEVTADGELREVTDSAWGRGQIGRDAPVTHISRADREAFLQRVLGDFDVNGDGRLDEQERASVHAAIEAGTLKFPARTIEPVPAAPSTANEASNRPLFTAPGEALGVKTQQQSNHAQP